mgnify:CR=1 FL=1
MQEIFQMLETEVRRHRERKQTANHLASAFLTFDDLIEIVEECRFQVEGEKERLFKEKIGENSEYSEYLRYSSNTQITAS